jgi:quercetin dioxygenase-like cupin family protein
MNINAADHKPGVPPNFIEPRDLGDRPWGQETMLCHVVGKFMMKKLFIKKGSKGGLQYHRFKDEAGILLSGKMIVRFEGDDKVLLEKVLGPGDVFHFPAGVVHQEEAIEDCLIIECGTPILNDRVRMENYFGLDDPIGMPTTTAEEVEFG